MNIPAEIASLHALVENGQWTEVWKQVNALKAQRRDVAGLDYLRARCFLHRQQPYAAIEALREELRYHPEHQPSAALLATLTRQHPLKPKQRDREFRQLYLQVQPFTMLTEARLWSLFNLAKEVCEADLPGDFVECGVAAGGSSALLASVIARHSRRPRRLYSCDSFAGMPPATPADQHAGQPANASGWGEGTCAAPEDSLRKICVQLGVSDLVEPVRGWFADTLPGLRARLGPIALLHMDGDWYSSTRDILLNLYDQVVPEGPIQIDDYGWWEGCRQAVEEFTTARGLRWPLQVIDETGVWFRKPRENS